MFINYICYMIRDLLDSYTTYKKVKEKKTTDIYDFEGVHYSLEFHHTFGISFPNHGRTMLTLDEEDIEYFMRKYLPKLADELREEMDKLKDKYKE